MNGGRVRAVQRGPLTGLIALVVLLGALDAVVGLDTTGWLAGGTLGALTHGTLWRGLGGRGRGPGPADRVTLARCVLVCAVGALTADSFHRQAPVTVLVSITVVALLLDAVDGRVARRTGTVSRLGARFDMEVDALLILVLSAYVAPAVGWWVLAIGLARYARALGGWLLPWLARDAPPRHWGKVVAAVQGVVLTGVAAEVLPHSVVVGALAGAAVLLAESFGREVGWLWRHRAVGATQSRRELAGVQR
jgi:phosphatidylglycerophosphate synthase